MADGFLSAPFSLTGKKIWIAGHNGMVGRALLRRLSSENIEVMTVDRDRLDLRDPSGVNAWMRAGRPDVIVLAAARVGGIGANAAQPAGFLYDNLMIAANVIHAAHMNGAEKLLFLGSSCMYPRDAAQPLAEDALLTGVPEPTNEAYAVAKIAGIKLCQAYRKQHGCDFISAIPCNLYGPWDSFDREQSHVIPALIMKAHAAKTSGARSLEVWGTGKPLREFLYVDDLADALVFLLKNYSGGKPVNAGSGQEIPVAALARKISEVTGFKGEIVFDSSKPDGVFRKLMDSSRILNAGWTPQTNLDDGLHKTCRWYQSRNGLERAA